MVKLVQFRAGSTEELWINPEHVVMLKASPPSAVNVYLNAKGGRHPTSKVLEYPQLVERVEGPVEDVAKKLMG